MNAWGGSSQAGNFPLRPAMAEHGTNWRPSDRYKNGINVSLTRTRITSLISWYYVATETSAKQQQQQQRRRRRNSDSKSYGTSAQLRQAALWLAITRHWSGARKVHEMWAENGSCQKPPLHQHVTKLYNVINTLNRFLSDIIFSQQNYFQHKHNNCMPATSE